MRRKLVAPAALVGVLLVASSAWAPPPRPAPRPTPPPTPPRPAPPRTTPTPSHPSPSFPSRPSIGSAKPAFGASFEAARGRSAAEAAEVLRKQGAFLARNQRAAMLTVVIHQTLRQKQPASLAELRHLRADCGGVGPGVLDPIVLMELEAAESAAERVLLAEILRLIAAGQYVAAAEKIDHLESPRHLPAAAAQALPDLRDELKRAAPLVRMRASLNRNGSADEVAGLIAALPKERIAGPIADTMLAWANLVEVGRMMDGGQPEVVSREFVPHTVEAMDAALRSVGRTVGAGVAGRLRVELAARMILTGRPKDATALLDGAVDPAHAAAVITDLRAIALGRGEVVTPQVAKFGPPWAGVEGLPPGQPPEVATAVLPPDRLAKWQAPTRKAGETTVNAAITDARAKLKAAVEVTANASVAQVNAAADRIRAALAAEAAPQKAFLDKVEAFRGKPLATPVEVQLAIVAAARGFTVAEAVGVLAADADRPAAAARLFATVPALASPAAFAAAVEVSGRASVAFASHPDAGFKLVAASPTRARLRDTIGATLGAHAQKVANGLNPDPPTRADLEAEVARRLNTGGAIPPAEVVQALLDVCRDGADDYTRLANVARTLDELISQIGAARLSDDDQELQDEFAIAKTRRIGVQYDRKRAEAIVTAGCNLLGAYGRDAAPAISWLGAQNEWTPWRAAAVRGFARITEGK